MIDLFQMRTKFMPPYSQQNMHRPLGLGLFGNTSKNVSKETRALSVKLQNSLENIFFSGEGNCSHSYCKFVEKIGLEVGWSQKAQNLTFFSISAAFIKYN